MPGYDAQADAVKNLWHSWDLGLVHWLAYNTENYFEYDAMDGHGGVHR